MKFKDAVGIVSFLIGTYGVAGAIENDNSLVLPISLFLLGTVLIFRGANEKENIHDCSDTSTRLHFLP